ncbi:hypothetical protein QYE76_071604 [Lolium multiflorum]|uniref:Reverse transcriptase domain-containing protein n=1 Tax=Lolium multiflorum TaxID=4521 RepID=A0AAD8SLG9_LOLMU|nr:hypothetical protein QYE76_071604 [Lolium multiflorum]
MAEEITHAEHKKKYDELKAIREAELIGSFETTRSHNIKLKGNTCPSHGVNTVDLSHSIREPGFSFNVNMARLVNCHRTKQRVATLVAKIKKRPFHATGPKMIDGLFEYVVMTFGLKNAGATYQRAMNYIFHDLIGKLVEIYIDDVVVKSAATDGHLEDLRRVLDRTRKFGLRMNPKKCAFGVTAGQFLGFLVHERGIEIGLKSQEAVRTMKPPTTKKELQCLIGKINFVRRFISNLSGE